MKEKKVVVSPPVTQGIAELLRGFGNLNRGAVIAIDAFSQQWMIHLVKFKALFTESERNFIRSSRGGIMDVMETIKGDPVIENKISGLTDYEKFFFEIWARRWMR